MTQETSEWIQDLPKVPVPDLHKTLERYLAGLKPVIPVAQYEQTKRTVEEFSKPNGEGEKLHALLQEYANEKQNWITELWMDDMYYLNAIPLPVNSSPFYLFPKQLFRTSNDQLKLACRVIQFSYLFKEQIDKQTLSQDSGSGHGRGQPLCMQTYKHFFSAYRIAGEDKDELVLDANSVNSDCDHIIIACRNQFFVLQLKRNEFPTEDFLLENLKYIWYSSKEYESSTPLVGVLTTDNRKTWGNTRNKILLKEANKQSLKYIETCLYVLCLDDSLTAKVGKSVRRDSIQMARMDINYMASTLLHGGGTQFYSANRWYDKFLQIVIEKHGIFGIVCEHSASEGITVLRFCEEFLDYLEKNPYQTSSSCNRKDSLKGFHKTTQTNSATNPQKYVKRLLWDIDNTISLQIQDSTKRIDKLVSDLDMYVLHFNEYGKKFIKQQSMSPDAYIQLALQLTYYKVHRKLVSTYESASIRQYRLGRVDNIRASTIESLAWVKAMCDEIPEITEKHKVEMFHKAIKKQMEILKYTITGYGPDNHLLGLKEMSKIAFGDIPALFKEKSYKEFINFRLSTSQLPTERGILVGYGPVVADGYGCSYNPCNDYIIFCISSFFSFGETSSDFFALSLEGSMLQMRELCVKLTSHQTLNNQTLNNA